MLIYIIFIIGLFVFFYNRTQKSVEGFRIKDNQKEPDEKENRSDKDEVSEKSCLIDVDLNNSLKTHLENLSKKQVNKNLLKPSFPIASNYLDNLEFNVLNEYGIKDIRKRQEYNKAIKNGVISQNSRLLLKNFNKQLFENKNDKIRPQKCIND